MNLMTMSTASASQSGTSMIMRNTPRSFVVLALMLSMTDALSMMRQSQQTFGILSRTSGFLHPMHYDRRSFDTSTRLQYSDGVEDEPLQKMRLIKLRQWFSKMLPKETPSSQREVDEYLEFLDKRYHRLHDEELPKKPAPRRFSVLNWLKESPQPVSQEECADALYVLGVADHASKRLLQKRSLPRPEETGVVIEAHASEVPMTSRPENPSSGDEGELRCPRRTLSKARSLLRAVQMATEAKALCGRTMRSSKNLVRAMWCASGKRPWKAFVGIWRIGAGRDNIFLTASVLTMVFAMSILEVQQS